MVMAIVHKRTQDGRAHAGLFRIAGLGAAMNLGFNPRDKLDSASGYLGCRLGVDVRPLEQESYSDQVSTTSGSTTRSTTSVDVLLAALGKGLVVLKAPE